MATDPSSLLDPGSPHASTPTSPSFNAQTRQTQLRPTSRPNTPDPSHGSYVDFVRTWNDAHVARWLAECKCPHQASTFANNDIRGDVLLELDQPTLREMGISSVGDRIKILNGVKALRVMCASPKASSAPPFKINGHTNLPVRLHPDSADVVLVPSSRPTHKRLDSGRPPPLHLTPTVGRDLPQLDSSRTPRGGSQVYQGHTHTHSGSSTKDSNGMIRGLPPLPPPPRMTPPAPPTNNSSQSRPSLPSANGAGPRPHHLAPNHVSSGRRTPTQAENPPSFTSQPLPPAPTPATPSWSNEYGLPRGPGPGNLGGGRTPGAIATRATSPLPLQPPRSRTVALQPGAHKPSVSTSGLPHHPYAAPPQSNVLHPPANSAATLSPIAETFMNGNLSPSPSATGPSPNSQGYSVGRGPFRPTTPSSRPPMSAEDIRRRCVKFILADDGITRVVNVEDCGRGSDILELVLRKFGKSAGIGFPTMGGAEESDLFDPDDGLIVDGWGLFLEYPDTPARLLSETQLLFICQEPGNPAREQGLTLRRIVGRPKRSKALAHYFGETPPANLDHPSSVPTALAPPPIPPQDTRTMKQMNRASSVSILSSLGVPDPERALAPSKPASPSPSLRAKTQNKLRNFLGQRPPSELITTHLQEYFPFTERKVLERTQRQSMMLRADSSNRRISRQSWKSWNTPPLPDSRSASSASRAISPLLPPAAGDSSSIRSTATDLSGPPPRMSVETDDGTSIDVLDDPSIAPPPELPPVQFPTESLAESMGELGRSVSRSSRTRSDASRTSRRMSYLIELRSKRDRSDTGSMLTVDEITQEVESRRASLVAEGKDPEAENTAVEEEGEEETYVEEDEEEEEDLGTTAVDDDDEEDAEEHKAVTSNAGKRAIKWIKGALIGAGSFGSVYLGMDAFNGLLMAVKQVELPTGSAPNEERKKSMLSALEREIELLKELQHENIVQYLDSSTDGVHLNIFLEYVPGGSVATLLKNYGAFEEALVRNFGRQILQGLNYLHSRDIIHRDIKGGNILVDNKGGIKISDFGISKKVEDNLLVSARVNRPSLQGSVFWMAPEVVKQTSYTMKADIWSVGCLVVEMLTGEHPWAQLTQMQAIFKIGSSAKPSIPSDISTDAEDFLNKTFELDHTMRPAADALLHHPWIIMDPANPATAVKSKPAPATS